MPYSVFRRLGPPTYARLSSLGAPEWATPPGKATPFIGTTYDAMDVGASSDVPVAQNSGVGVTGTASAFWVADTFHADQAAQICQGPPAFVPGFGGSTLDNQKSIGAAVRGSLSSDTCYVARVVFQDDMDASGAVAPWLLVERWRNGTATELARVGSIPPWSYQDDWWCYELETWGADPVNLRVTFKAPVELIGPVPEPATLPNFAGLSYLVNGVTHTHNPEVGYYYVPEAPTGYGPNLAPYFTFNESSQAVDVNAPGAINSASRVWQVWSGQDNHADQIRSGQPGIHWRRQWNQAGMFWVRELTEKLHVTGQTRNGSSVTLSGYRPPNATVTVRRS